MSEASLCVVLNENIYRDNDKMLSLFSKEHGRVDALARGARKQTSDLRACCHVFCYGEYFFNISKGRYYLSQCVLKDSFYNICKDIDAYYAGVYICEVINKTVMPGEESSALFSVVVNCLNALNKGAKPRDVICFFIIKHLHISGFLEIDKYEQYIKKILSTKNTELISAQFDFEQAYFGHCVSKICKDLGMEFKTDISLIH